ncbi:hypothetical protein D7X33_17095 [Butyricicoccus sp. 1XD8-22]|nr:hypothetical protein D7X33_17095 [Butyricicoccus sp. 1XD8-22]
MRPTPARRAAGRCPAPGGALPLHPTPTRRAAGRCPAPAGAFAPDPEMLAHLCIACGRDGGWGFLFGRVLNDQPAMMTAGWSGYACV